MEATDDSRRRLILMMNIRVQATVST